jgi:NAD(P)-dependent dehydrogenase (short-subunit alcohol dehydrogenase family)
MAPEKYALVTGSSRGIGRGIALKLLGRGVRVAVRYYQNNEAAPARSALGTSWTPMRRLGTPAEAGNAVALLCSPEAAWITGQLIDVVGGAALMDAHLLREIHQSRAA